MNAERQWETADPAATQALAGQLARAIRGLLAGEGPEANLVVGLSGDLGAGKTTFSHGFVQALDPALGAEVTSPTYALVQRYDSEPPVTHMDLYRLGSLDDLEAIGYRDHFFGPGVALVEWIDRVPEAAPADWLEIRLAAAGPQARTIRLIPHGPRSGHIVREVSTP